MGDDTASTAAWLAAGLAGLTGRPDGPPRLPSSGTIDAVVALVADAPVDEPLVLLGERAALAGHTRAGSTSCGGSARLLPVADGWVAVNLARPEDVELLRAWLGLVVDPDDPWAAVADAAGSYAAADLVSGAIELGLPVSSVGEAAVAGLADRSDTAAARGVRSADDPSGGGHGPAGLPAGGGQGAADPPAAGGLPSGSDRSGADPRDGISRARLGDRSPRARPPIVVDLSSLWAGPLCSHLLGLEGARVVKVESTRRPDGGRQDETGFFDLLNHGKASVALDLPSTHGLARLRALLAAADVVIEGSRPRVLRGWGIEPDTYLAMEDGPRVWVSITGYGRTGPAANRVGFGDDAAAAGGLVVWDDAGPCFLVDAVADPLTGIATARAVTEALAEGGSWLLDVALARVAASVVHPGASVPFTEPSPPPRARPVPGPARPLGADTDTILAKLP